MCVHTPYMCLAPREVRMGPGSLGLELQMLQTIPWVLGTEPRSTTPRLQLLCLHVKEWNSQALVITSTKGSYLWSRFDSIGLLDKIIPLHLPLKNLNYFIDKNSQIKLSHSQIKVTLQTNTCPVPDLVSVSSCAVGRALWGCGLWSSIFIHLPQKKKNPMTEWKQEKKWTW